MRQLKNYHKRAMTLLEVMIAMGLTLLLLSTLSYMFLFVEKVNSRTEAQQEKSFDYFFLEHRLNYLMKQTYSPRQVAEHYYFFTSQTLDSHLFKPGSSSLVFSFNNGAVFDKPFANQVIGRLYLDPQGRLCLAIWPLPEEQKKNLSTQLHKEILLKNVESLDFSFLVPPLKDRTKVWKDAPQGLLKQLSQNELPASGFNHKQWKSSYPSLPAMVRIELKLTNQDKPLVFSIPLPQSDLTIVYGGDR